MKTRTESPRRMNGMASRRWPLAAAGHAGENEQQQSVGCVSSPIMMLTTTTTPKWTRSIPERFRVGNEDRDHDSSDRTALKQAARINRRCDDQQKAARRSIEPPMKCASELGIFSTVTT